MEGSAKIYGWFDSPVPPPRTSIKLTEGTRLVGMLLISSSWFDSPVFYCTSIEPVYHRGNKASGEESHQFDLVRFSKTTLNQK